MKYPFVVPSKWPNSTSQHIYDRILNLIFLNILDAITQSSQIVVNRLSRSYIWYLDFEAVCIMVGEFTLRIRFARNMILNIWIALMIFSQSIHKGFISAIITWDPFGPHNEHTLHVY